MVLNHCIFGVILIAAIILAPAQAIAESREVRDRNGRLIERWTKKPSGRVEIRDANGTLLRTRMRRGNRIIIRDGSGRLIAEERIQ